jgi:hypothetical protein
MFYRGPCFCNWITLKFTGSLRLSVNYVQWSSLGSLCLSAYYSEVPWGLSELQWSSLGSLSFGVLQCHSLEFLWSRGYLRLWSARHATSVRPHNVVSLPEMVQATGMSNYCTGLCLQGRWYANLLAVYLMHIYSLLCHYQLRILPAQYSYMSIKGIILGREFTEHKMCFHSLYKLCLKHSSL